MPEYKTPGVYVEEVDRGSKPIEGVSTSTAGFLGATERGRTAPQLVTSFPDFRRKYGGFIESSYLSYAVEGYFRNGGSRCYVGRVAAVADDVASTTLVDDEDDAQADDVLEVSAVGPGSWGGNVAVVVDDGTLYKDGENELFAVTIRYWTDLEDVDGDPSDEEIVDAQDDPDREEVYDNLSPDESSSDFYEKRIGGVSTLVDVERVGPGRPINGTTLLDDVGEDDDVTVGDFQGSDEPGERTGLAAFETVDEAAIICAPDEVRSGLSGLMDELVDHCENRGDRFAILQAEQSAGSIGDLEPPRDTSYAAFYYPWLRIRDPATETRKLVPPGGHVAGIYSRSDQEKGVHKAPANEVVRGAQELQHSITKGEQATLNPRGVNCIRSFPGRGIRVWGARTMSSDPSWKYVNVRRLFLYLRSSIDEGTQWVVFENNDEELWARVRQTISNFLTGVWEDGALMGTTPDEAFFVKCDRSTMTQNDIDNGRLICEIGVAPVKPAEFVIFRISQWTEGAEG